MKISARDILVLGLILTWPSRVSSAEILGTVTKAAADTATIAIQGESVPNAGDPVTIYFKLPGTDDEVLVANGKVTGVAGDSVTVKIQDAKGKVEKDQLVRITSANPKPKSASVAASPPTPPSSPPSQWAEQVQAKYDRGDYDGAIAILTKAIEANPNDATAYYQRAVCYSAKQTWDNVIADAGRAIALGYTQPAYAYTLRGGGHTGKGNFQAATEDLTKAIALNPQYTRAYIVRTVVWLARVDAGISLTDWRNILEDCNKVIALTPDGSDAGKAYMYRGFYYSHVGDSESAEADWKRAININPADEKLIEQYRKRFAPKKKPSRKR